MGEQSALMKNPSEWSHVSWDDTPIPLLSEAYKNVMAGCFAQCQHCGFAYQDDVALVHGGLICPACSACPLKRGLSIEHLRAKSDFPNTFMS